MPKLLAETERDLLAEEVDRTLEAAEETAAPTVDFNGAFGDLSDGGNVGSARVHPMSAGKRVNQGRATVRRAWMWNGTEAVLPLAWDPEGKNHDGARHYLRKRHCTCCQQGGFASRTCPTCEKRNCSKCNGGTNRENIIPTFYLRLQDVPFPSNVYGSIPCFLPECVRRGAWGFLTEAAMRMHAASRHRMEYRAHLEAARSAESSEVADLRRRLDALMLAQTQPAPAAATPVVQGARRRAREYRARVRAAKRPGVPAAGPATAQ